jgi:hypothetical protein
MTLNQRLPQPLTTSRTGNICARRDNALIGSCDCRTGVESQAPDAEDRSGTPRCAYPSGMQPRRHRMRTSGTAVTIKTYARRYGVDRYTAYEDLTAIGFPLPDSAQRWAHRPPPQPCPRRSATSPALPDNDWMMMNGRPYYVAGYTPGGAPYGIYLDEMDDDYLNGMIIPGRPGKLLDPDPSGP